MIILTHIGTNLPDYIDCFLTQLRKFNKNRKIVFLVNENNLTNEVFIKNNIETYPINDLSPVGIYEFISLFGHGDVKSNEKFINYASPDYWCVTATRLFYLNEYCRKFNINNYFHFENDIMIYENIDIIEDVIKDNNLYCNKIAITRGTNNKIMTGFMYVDNNDILSDILNNFIFYLKNHSNLFNYGIDMVNEMGLLHIYQENNPTKMVNLPTLPEKPMNNSFESFNALFDPATYGQYIDGTPFEPGKSIITDSYIGDYIKNNPNSIIKFIEVNNLKIPFLFVGDKSYKINNLHIHSKRLNLFLS